MFDGTKWSFHLFSMFISPAISIVRLYILEKVSPERSAYMACTLPVNNDGNREELSGSSFGTMKACPS